MNFEEIVICTSVLLVIYLTVRNYLVFRERTKVLDAVYRLGLREIQSGGDADWRWKEFGATSYHEMMYKFWRPVSSFYAGARCLQPHEELV